jgi:hypothetical protein
MKPPLVSKIQSNPAVPPGVHRRDLPRSGFGIQGGRCIGRSCLIRRITSVCANGDNSRFNTPPDLRFRSHLISFSLFFSISLNEDWSPSDSTSATYNLAYRSPEATVRFSGSRCTPTEKLRQTLRESVPTTRKLLHAQSEATSDPPEGGAHPREVTDGTSEVSSDEPEVTSRPWEVDARLPEATARPSEVTVSPTEVGAR